MGEPANPTPQERVDARVLARSIVEAERCDEEWPDEIRELWAHRPVVYSIARELALTADAVEATVRAIDRRLAELNQVLEIYDRTPVIQMTALTLALMSERDTLTTVAGMLR